MSKQLHDPTTATQKQNSPDVNIPLTQREAIKNKIAELTAHGLNSNEIADYLEYITKGELVRVIKDYQQETEALDVG